MAAPLVINVLSDDDSAISIGSDEIESASEGPVVSIDEEEEEGGAETEAPLSEERFTTVVASLDCGPRNSVVCVIFYSAPLRVRRKPGEGAFGRGLERLRGLPCTAENQAAFVDVDAIEGEKIKVLGWHYHDLSMGDVLMSYEYRGEDKKPRVHTAMAHRRPPDKQKARIDIFAAMGAWLEGIDALYANPVTGLPYLGAPPSFNIELQVDGLEEMRQNGGVPLNCMIAGAAIAVLTSEDRRRGLPARLIRWTQKKSGVEHGEGKRKDLEHKKWSVFCAQRLLKLQGDSVPGKRLVWCAGQPTKLRKFELELGFGTPLKGDDLADSYNMAVAKARQMRNAVPLKKASESGPSKAKKKTKKTTRE